MLERSELAAGQTRSSCFQNRDAEIPQVGAGAPWARAGAGVAIRNQVVAAAVRSLRTMDMGIRARQRREERTGFSGCYPDYGMQQEGPGVVGRGQIGKSNEPEKVSVPPVMLTMPATCVAS